MEYEYFAYCCIQHESTHKKTHLKSTENVLDIESRYRLMNQARIHTSTKKPVRRLLYIGLSFLLVNIWIYIQWTYLSITTTRRTTKSNMDI
ncbi:MAG: hypothetical protein LBC39_08185 [Methanobrevibacter sp.]|nr:hypothetical protein [Candidatus Methanovirga aequatorialis]